MTSSNAPSRSSARRGQDDISIKITGLFQMELGIRHLQLCLLEWKARLWRGIFGRPERRVGVGSIDILIQAACTVEDEDSSLPRSRQRVPWGTLQAIL